jgi:glycine betaine/proline transport system substrate-binding protein
MGKRSRWSLAAVLALMLALLVAACGESKDDEADSGGGSADAGATDCGKVVLNEQAWAGSTANTYIAKAVLEDKLGCTVEITKLAEIPVFQAMADGKVDAVLEDWQHVDEYAKYIDKAGTVVQGGPLGVEGHIGWFIPKYLMDENPEFKSWEGLKGKEDLFKTAESGDQYTPQYLNQEYELAEVKLPPRTDANKDCKDDAKEGGDPAQYKCEYDVTIINKLFSKKFADSGSPAYDVLKNMKLTNEDQEQVAKAIAGDKEDPEQAVSHA